MKIFRIFLTESESRQVFHIFDDNENGVIEFNEFLSRMKGSINEKRKSLILQAFKKISSQTSGYGLTLDALRLSFNAQGHPDVKSQKKTSKDIEIEFRNYWGSGQELVKQEDFFGFYEVLPFFH